MRLRKINLLEQFGRCIWQRAKGPSNYGKSLSGANDGFEPSIVLLKHNRRELNIILLYNVRFKTAQETLKLYPYFGR